MVKLRTYLKPHAGRMAAGFALKFTGTVAELLLPLLLGYMFDDSENSPVRTTAALLLFGALMLALAFVALFGNIAANRLASRVARDSIVNIRKDLFGKTLSLSAGQINAFTLPSLVSRLSTDTYNVHNMIGMMQRLGVRVPIMLFGGLAFAFALEPVLTCILVAVLPVMLFVVLFIARKGIRLFARLQGSVDGMVRRVRSDYEGVRVIKALSRADYERAAFHGDAGEVAQSETRANLWTGASNPAVSLLLNLGMVAVVLVGAFRAQAGVMQPGKIVAFVSYFTLILNAAMTVSRLFVTLARGTASSRRICAVLNAPEEPLLLPAGERQGNARIRFENVSFSYGGTPALRSVSFSLDEGQKLGIVGATGSGKSTLVHLLLRFYDASEGRVFLDGRDVRTIPFEELRTRFGVVFQNDFIMEGTVEENVDFCRGLPAGAAERALRIAQADFVFARPEGINCPLAAHGANLSGGQKQRILIARALASSPDILILDDSSSALDYRTDAALRAAIEEACPQATAIYIAQRVSSVRGCDRILVLDGGRAVGFGSHAELMRTCPVYREISASQGGDLDDDSALPPEGEGGARHEV